MSWSLSHTHTHTHTSIFIKDLSTLVAYLWYSDVLVWLLSWKKGSWRFFWRVFFGCKPDTSKEDFRELSTWGQPRLYCREGLETSRVQMLACSVFSSLYAFLAQPAKFSLRFLLRDANTDSDWALEGSITRCERQAAGASTVRACSSLVSACSVCY